MQEIFHEPLIFLKNQGILKGEQNIIAAVSGGADSTALLLFLQECRRAYSIKIYVAHINHGLRGAASDADEQFVRDLCESLQLPFYTTRLFPDTNNQSEQWARQERYHFLFSLSKKLNAWIAVGHTMNDQAETVLFHLIRGSSVHGAAGISQRNGRVIRPFLSVTHAQLCEFLRQRHQPWREDETNATTQYTRGKIRNHILNQLEDVHTGATSALAHFAKQIREVQQWLSESAAFLCEQAKQTETSYQTSVLCGAPVAVQKEAIRQIILRHTERTEKVALCEKIHALLQLNGTIQVDTNFKIQVSQGQLRILLHQETQPQQNEIPFQLGQIDVNQHFQIEIKCILQEDFEKILKSSKKSLIFFADYDMIQKNSVFRKKKPGDFFTSARRKLTKPLKKWYSEAKLHPDEREKRIILAYENEVLWDEMLGFSKRVSVTEKTKIVLQMIIKKQGEMYDE